MENKAQNKKPVFLRRADVLIITGILLVALVAWLAFIRNRPEGATAVVTIMLNGEQTQQTIGLAKGGIYDIEGAALPVHLEVKDGGIRFVESVCPDHDCEGFGWLRHDGEWAACLPAGVTVTVREETAKG